MKESIEILKKKFPEHREELDSLEMRLAAVPAAESHKILHAIREMLSCAEMKSSSYQNDRSWQLPEEHEKLTVSQLKEKKFKQIAEITGINIRNCEELLDAVLCVSMQGDPLEQGRTLFLMSQAICLSYIEKFDLV